MTRLGPMDPRLPPYLLAARIAGVVANVIWAQRNGGEGGSHPPPALANNGSIITLSRKGSTTHLLGESGEASPLGVHHVAAHPTSPTERLEDAKNAG